MASPACIVVLCFALATLTFGAPNVDFSNFDVDAPSGLPGPKAGQKDTTHQRSPVLTSGDQTQAAPGHQGQGTQGQGTQGQGAQGQGTQGQGDQGQGATGQGTQGQGTQGQGAQGQGAQGQGAQGQGTQGQGAQGQGAQGQGAQGQGTQGQGAQGQGATGQGTQGQGAQGQETQGQGAQGQGTQGQGTQGQGTQGQGTQGQGTQGQGTQGQGTQGQGTQGQGTQGQGTQGQGTQGQGTQGQGTQGQGTQGQGTQGQGTQGQGTQGQGTQGQGTQGQGTQGQGTQGQGTQGQGNQGQNPPPPPPTPTVKTIAYEFGTPSRYDIQISPDAPFVDATSPTARDYAATAKYTDLKNRKITFVRVVTRQTGDAAANIVEGAIGTPSVKVAINVTGSLSYQHEAKFYTSSLQSNFAALGNSTAKDVILARVNGGEQYSKEKDAKQVITYPGTTEKLKDKKVTYVVITTRQTSDKLKAEVTKGDLIKKSKDPLQITLTAPATKEFEYEVVFYSSAARSQPLIFTAAVSLLVFLWSRVV